MTVTIEKIEDRLTLLGFKRGEEIANMGVFWDSPPLPSGFVGRWLLSFKPEEAQEQLIDMELTVFRGDRLALGRHHVIERVRALRDSRARYLSPSPDDDDLIRFQVNTLDSLLSILTGDEDVMKGFAHSFDWDGYADLVELQGTPLHD